MLRFVKAKTQGHFWPCLFQGQAPRGLASGVQGDFEIDLPQGPPLRLAFGKLAKMADGSAVASMGKTSVLMTSVCNSDDSGIGVSSFVPLTVNYKQKSAAAGRIPTNFLRREMGPSEHDILTARVIDRSIRAKFPKGFSCETQLTSNLLSIDGMHDPVVVAMNAASASLASSDIPWQGPVGSVRVGLIDGQLVINPDRKQMLQSQLNLLLTGTVKAEAVMLEAEAANISKDIFLEAVATGLDSCAIIAKEIHRITESVTKRELKVVSSLHEGIMDDMELLCRQRLTAIYHDHSFDKAGRHKATFEVRDEAVSQIRMSHPHIDVSGLHDCFSRISRQVLTSLAVNEGLRVDGRGFNDIRPITCETDLFKPLHGSALFQRGQTQVLCTVALDSLESALKTDPLSVLTGAVQEKNFFLHYEFPPYATNEVGRMTFGRRELGHGVLAEKALKHVIPKDFPFTIRLTSEVLESNGSSSMATVCGGSMALLDAGIPISEPAAGVAVGLFSEHDQEGNMKDHVTMLDILGLEDFLGDMDFKVAGTRQGITALQADIKIPGLPLHVIEQALNQGHAGISTILDIMDKTISEPRTDKTNLPVNEVIDVPVHKRGQLVGPGGVNLRRLTSTTGAQLSQRPDGNNSTWSLFAPNPEAMSEAKEFIEDLLDDQTVPEFEFGAILQAVIREIKDRGVMVELHPNMDLVFIPVSQLSATRVKDTSVLNFQLGQTIQVKYFGRDPETGSIRLSKRALQVATASAIRLLNKSTKRLVD